MPQPAMRNSNNAASSLGRAVAGAGMSQHRIGDRKRMAQSILESQKGFCQINCLKIN